MSEIVFVIKITEIKITEISSKFTQKKIEYEAFPVQYMEQGNKDMYPMYK